MTSLNQINVQFSESGQKEVLQALKNLDKAQDTLNRGIRASVDSSNKNAKSLDRIAREAAKAQREMDRLSKAVQKGTIAESQFHGEANTIAKRLRALGMDRAQSEVIRYKNALLQTADGSRILSTATVKATARSDQLENQVRQTTAAVNAQAGAQRFYGRNVSKAGVLTQQAGYQVGDFIVQVQSGTNAFVAFGQQATQIAGTLTLLGGKYVAIGTVLGLVIPLATAFGAALMRTGGAGEIFEELAFAIEPIKPLLDALAVAMSTVADVTIDFVNLLVNNLDRIVVAATVVAGFFAAKWVAAFIAAGKATLVLNGALNLVRATLLRLPFIALIAGATELIYQFTQLAKGAGGFGAAFSLVGDVVEEVFGKVDNYLFSLALRAMESASNVKASFLGKLGDVIEWLPSNFVNRMIGAFTGPYEAAKSVWGELPDLFARFGAIAANKLVSIMEGAGNALAAPINFVREAVGKEPLQPFDLSEFKKTVPEIGDIGKKAKDAFVKAATTDYVGDALSGVRGAEQDAMRDASIFGGLAEIFEAEASKPIESIDKLREAMKKADEQGRDIDVRDWFGGLGSTDEGGDSGSGGSSATEEAIKKLEEMREKIQSIADTIKDSMSDAFMSIVDGTKSASDAFKDMARSILKQLFDVLVVQQLVGSFDAKTGTGSGIVGGIMGLFGGGSSGATPIGPVTGAGGLYANGGAFSNGRVIPFADGGVVSSPTMFPMDGQKTGVMGEAGPEAIMPLKRTKGGKLGVVAEGASQPVVIHQNFNFSANGDDSVKRIIAQEAPKIANLTQKQILDQRSRGGTFKQVFG